MMKFVQKPSLEHMALVQICISLWKQNDVWALISELNYDDLLLNLSDWEKIEERVTKKVPELLLPQLSKEKVFGAIKPVGEQIYKWMQYYREYDSCRGFQRRNLQSCPAELCWTPQGTVDKKRTSEILIRDENLDVSRRYKLACDYFLEEDVIRLWNRLPEDLKDYDYNNHPVMRFWSDNMKREGAGPISYKEVFYRTALSGNKVAAKYFLEKLTPQERKECLKEFTKYIDDADVFIFLISEMGEEEQKEVLKSDPHKVLQYFLQWPWQSFFIGVANCMWDFLSRNSYDEILGDTIHKVRVGYKDYNYQKLFREIWQKSPSALKDLVIEDIDKSSLLESLILVKDKENIRLILKDSTLTAKEKFIFSEEFDYYLTHFVHENDWDFLEFCIREFLSSKSQMLKFKKKFGKHMYFKRYSAAEKHKWRQFFASLMTPFVNTVKSVEEGRSSSSK